MSGRLLSLGHGYTAQALARQLTAAGWQITGTSRSGDHLPAIAASGARPLLWPSDHDHSALEAALATASHLLISAAPTAEGDPVLTALSEQIAAAPGLVWIGYLSTTAVYGDHQGGWVDETTPATPGTRRGAWRLAAEQGWRDLAARAALPLHIFRLAGIYGPGRGPFSKVRDGTARRILKPGQVFSRVHVADIAQALAASMRAPAAAPGGCEVYNLCDDDPAPPEDVIAHAAKLLGLPLPPAEDFATAEMSPMARSFYAESKRVRNDRLHRDLGIKLLYPDYRAGLAALLAEEEATQAKGAPKGP